MSPRQKCRYIRAIPDYRRNRVPGGTYSFTINLANRRSDLVVREIETLRAAIRAVRQTTPFHIDAWVTLPDHMHCVWTLPEDDIDYSGRWRAIKKRFSKALPNVELIRPEVLAQEGRGIWQKRFWEHTIRDDQDYRARMDYVHFNPVKHGFVAHPAQWPYSTLQKCVALGLYDAAWASPNHETNPFGMGALVKMAEGASLFPPYACLLKVNIGCLLKVNIGRSCAWWGWCRCDWDEMGILDFAGGDGGGRGDGAGAGFERV